MVNQYMTPEQAEASSPYGSGGTPATRTEADAGNVVGRQNRANVGLGSGYGGYSGQQLDTVNQQRTQQEQNQREQDRLNYEQRARVNAGLRPGYTDPSELGDTSTQNFRKMNRMLAMSGMPTVSDDAFTGYVLGAQYKMAVSTPGTRDDQFFLNEIGKWNRNPIELSSAYHDVGMNVGVPIPANPFENRGDISLVLEKGGNLKDFTPDRYGFNQNVGKELGLLPGGRGIQETQWEIAKTGRAADVDFQPAIDYQVSQTGRYGVYGNLAGGIPDKVDVPVASREPIGNARLAVPGTMNPTPTGTDWNPFVASAAEPIGFIGEGMQIPKSAPSEQKAFYAPLFDWFDNVNKEISEKYTKPYLPEINATPEETGLVTRAVSFTNPGLFLMTSNPIYGKQASEFIGSVAIGEYEGLREKPATAAISMAAGVGLGAGFKALDVVGTKSAVIAAEQYPTAAKTFTTFSTKVFPAVLAGLYATDVAIRSTQSGQDLKPANVGYKFGEILSTETVPMVVGGYAGYKATDAVLSRVPSLYTVPGEAEIITGAKPEQREVTKATIDTFKNLNRIESPMQNKPQFSQVTGVGENAAGVETIIKGQNPTVFGRTVETGQMPQEWIDVRGTTKDIDFFTPEPSQAGRELYRAYPKDYVPKNNEDFTAIMSKETGQTAFDIHPYPSGYPVGKQGSELPVSDYVKAQLNPIPSRSGILKTDIPQEHLYVQARRKATSVLGEEVGEFGPPEHRMKDVVDLLNYNSYLSQQTGGFRKAALERDFNILKDFYIKPENYGGYLEGEKYAGILKSMKFGKPTEPINTPIKTIGREDVEFSSIPSTYRNKVYPSILGSTSPLISKVSQLGSPSPSPTSSSPSIISSPSPIITSPTPIISTTSIGSRLRSVPPYFPPPSVPRSPSTPSPTTSVPPYVPPPSVPPYSPTISVPPYTPPSSPRITPPTVPPVLLPNFGGASQSFGKKRRPRKFQEIFPFGIDIATMSFEGIKRPKGVAKKGRVIPKSMLTPARRRKK